LVGADPRRLPTGTEIWRSEARWFYLCRGLGFRSSLIFLWSRRRAAAAELRCVAHRRKWETVGPSWQNRTFGPCLAAMHRTLTPVMVACSGQRLRGRGGGGRHGDRLFPRLAGATRFRGPPDSATGRVDGDKPQRAETDALSAAASSTTPERNQPMQWWQRSHFPVISNCWRPYALLKPMGRCWSCLACRIECLVLYLVAFDRILISVMCWGTAAPSIT
jgi:hypothetical protein